jgi:hypothetical protein
LQPRVGQKIVRRQDAGDLAEEEVICAGTIAGEFETFKRLISRIYDSSTDRFGDDQAALNVLLRTEFKDVMSIPRHRGLHLDSGMVAHRWRQRKRKTKQ